MFSEPLSRPQKITRFAGMDLLLSTHILGQQRRQCEVVQPLQKQDGCLLVLHDASNDSPVQSIYTSTDRTISQSGLGRNMEALDSTGDSELISDVPFSLVASLRRLSISSTSYKYEIF